jgi:uncharacterized damage-inducible protein DinB
VSRILRSLAVLALLAPALAAQAPTTGWRGEFLVTLNTAADKYIQLAEAMPADKMTWRPADGVRSVAEVLLHVANANYGLAARLGATPIAGLDLRGLEKSTTDKAEVVRHLRAAFEHFRAAVIAYPDGDAEKMIRWFGPPEISMRHFLYFNADHNGEHLGQLIAYARMNGVRPPWSPAGN